MNTKPILRCVAAAFAALAALACSKDDAANPETPDASGAPAPYTITATMDEAPETRVAASDDGSSKIELKWKTGDQIYVINGNGTSETLYTFKIGTISADGKTASFTAPAGYDGTPAYAFHNGSGRINVFNPAGISPFNSAYQTAASSLPDIFPLYAVYDSQARQLKFKPFFAVLKFNVTLPEGASGTLSRLRIGSKDGSEIFYGSAYDITSGEAVRTGSSMANNIIRTGGSSFSGNTEKSVYLPFSPGTELIGKELEIDLLVGTSVYTATVKGAKLEAGKCYPLTLGAAKWTVRKIYEGGTGDAETPYEIANESNLQALARAVRTGERYSSKYFRLTGDISGIQTSAAEPWLPIGAGYSFGGHFDGNGKTVGGTFHLADKDGTHLGFFGYCNTISDLTLEGDVIYRGSGNPYTLYLGGIAGYCSGEISGCTHKEALTAQNTEAKTVYAGGIAGYTSKNITGCTRSGGTISVNMPNASLSVGGIAGKLYGSSTVMHTCYNASSITATGAFVYVGALVGNNTGTVYGCSTFPDNLTVTVNGTLQNSVKAIGIGSSGHNVPQPCPDNHTAR